MIDHLFQGTKYCIHRYCHNFLEGANLQCYGNRMFVHLKKIKMGCK